MQFTHYTFYRMHRWSQMQLLVFNNLCIALVNSILNWQFLLVMWSKVIIWTENYASEKMKHIKNSQNWNLRKDLFSFIYFFWRGEVAGYLQYVKATFQPFKWFQRFFWHRGSPKLFIQCKYLTVLNLRQEHTCKKTCCSFYQSNALQLNVQFI